MDAQDAVLGARIPHQHSWVERQSPWLPAVAVERCRCGALREHAFGVVIPDPSKGA